ncbi:hypothetical protein GCM10011391_26410 [Pullulanibacillus camelliae]|uniref:Coupling factor for flagellin transcription and translation n=1 Tax=Pullulanibacillus camelliae TaxID=1707096 RepID=A0A8J3DXV4_9BACL|nr:hypothetical protein [Pullulanibacillus camelliae]GGE46321.1 hypothetical protein GCM10011391_26410 [Pullulanibacillus camelliae]
MEYVFIIFSLCLHLVAFYLIVILVQRMNKLKNDMTGGVDQESIQVTLDHYLEEIRQENDDLIKRLKRLENAEKKQEQVPASEPVAEKKQPGPSSAPPPAPKENKTSFAEQLKASMIVEEPSGLPTEDVEDTVEQSMASRILQLHESGLSVEAIAQQLNQGKGEVELIINIHNKRQS